LTRPMLKNFQLLTNMLKLMILGSTFRDVF